MPQKTTSKRSAKVHEPVHERAIWRGSISFGLVQIPVGLFRAESDNSLHFTMLDKRDHAPVRFERKNGQTGKPIRWNDIVKGYEVQRGSYIIMTDDDFEAANVAATGGIDIIDFVEAREVDPMYYSKPYYLVPQDKGEKTYALLREALRRADKVGVAKIVIRTRQHLALVRVHHDALVLELLRFPHELRPVTDLHFPRRAIKALGISEREMGMASSLIDSMSGRWEPDSYHDDYHEDLLALIEKKRRQGAKAISVPEAPPKGTKAQVVDIMKLLQQSVAAQAPKKAKKATQKKAAPKRKTAVKKSPSAADSKRRPTQSVAGKSKTGSTRKASGRTARVG